MPEAMHDVRRIYGNRWSESELQEMRNIWRVLVQDFFQQFIDENASVLDIGAGFCHFINCVKAARRIAMDANPSVRTYVGPGVEAMVTSDLTLPQIDDGALHHVFISNFLEHLDDSREVIALLDTVHRKLRPLGSVLILQPNYRLTGADYFDFIDHHVVLTDRSLAEALKISGFTITHLVKRFLPYTSRSWFPRSPTLVRAYLKIPIVWRWLGRQTFVVARKRPREAVPGEPWFVPVHECRAAHT